MFCSYPLGILLPLPLQLPVRLLLLDLGGEAVASLKSMSTAADAGMRIACRCCRTAASAVNRSYTDSLPEELYNLQSNNTGMQFNPTSSLL